MLKPSPMSYQDPQHNKMSLNDAILYENTVHLMIKGCIHACMLFFSSNIGCAYNQTIAIIISEMTSCMCELVTVYIINLLFRIP